MKKGYDLEIDRILKEINSNKYKLICIQLPDGLKQKAQDIQDEIEKKTDCKVIIYAGSCWGGCDIPLTLDKLGVELLVQFGHAVFIRPW